MITHHHPCKSAKFVVKKDSSHHSALFKSQLRASPRNLWENRFFTPLRSVQNDRAHHLILKNIIRAQEIRIMIPHNRIQKIFIRFRYFRGHQRAD